MNGLFGKLKREFQDRESRHIYVNEFLNASIAAQIKALREKLGMTQARLAERAGMKQSRISALENVNYSSWSIRTLRRLAEVFDVTLVVKFEGFGQRIKDIENFNPTALAVPAFKDDPLLTSRYGLWKVIELPSKYPQKVTGDVSPEAEPEPQELQNIDTNEPDRPHAAA